MEIPTSARNNREENMDKGDAIDCVIFRARNATLLYAQLKIFFKEVYCAKPKSSRQSSCEAFVVCRGYSPPEGYQPTLENPMFAPNYVIVIWTKRGTVAVYGCNDGMYVC
ncbi:hypothetical protein COOONC_24160 [Cooperia oncophora]